MVCFKKMNIAIFVAVVGGSLLPPSLRRPPPASKKNMGRPRQCERCRIPTFRGYTKILAFSSKRPNSTATENFVRIYVNDASWGSSTCRSDAADLAATEKNILSVLLSAWVTTKTIDIAVDDTLRPIDTVCQLVWASAK